MALIRIDPNPTELTLKGLGVMKWPVWEKEVSEFPWFYGCGETCYFLEGEVMVTPEGQAPVCIKKGMLAIFPEGMQCTWKVISPIRKHYKFE